MNGKDKTELEVMICAYGADGLRRIACNAHPQLPGVRYLVSWQPAGADISAIPAEIVTRTDFVVHITDSNGLSRNRNNALEHATAPLLLISDDDVSYTADGLKAVLAFFSGNPECDVATFRYESAGAPKWFPVNSFDLRKPAKGYFVTSFEIALRRSILQRTGVRFNERFGINSEFIAGEEDIFIHQLLKNGARGYYVPTVICRHDGDTTCDRMGSEDTFIRVKGAVFTLTHPRTWPLRMLAHAHRERHRFPGGIVAYCRAWLSGARDARDLRLFK